MVKVRLRNGEEVIDRAYRFDWSIDHRASGRVITHYVIGQIIYPDFDYVEPKVWTVDYHGATTQHRLYKNGGLVYSCNYGESTSKAMKDLADALNAMEKRNATE